MTRRDSWMEAFPAKEATIAVEYLVKVWKRISARRPDQIKFSIKEPRLTECLYGYLLGPG